MSGFGLDTVTTGFTEDAFPVYTLDDGSMMPGLSKNQLRDVEEIGRSLGLGTDLARCAMNWASWQYVIQNTGDMRSVIGRMKSGYLTFDAM